MEPRLLARKSQSPHWRERGR
jgi:FtsK/SpoIIIE family